MSPGLESGPLWWGNTPQGCFSGATSPVTPFLSPQAEVSGLPQSWILVVLMPPGHLWASLWSSPEARAVLTVETMSHQEKVKSPSANRRPGHVPRGPSGTCMSAGIPSEETGSVWFIWEWFWYKIAPVNGKITQLKTLPHGKGFNSLTTLRVNEEWLYDDLLQNHIVPDTCKIIYVLFSHSRPLSFKPIAACAYTQIAPCMPGTSPSLPATLSPSFWPGEPGRASQRPERLGAALAAPWAGTFLYAHASLSLVAWPCPGLDASVRRMSRWMTQVGAEEATEEKGKKEGGGRGMVIISHTAGKIK